MDSKETRYAIIIGINDYNEQPLSFCVNDASGIKEALINKCMFYEENIFMITSDKDNSSKDIVGRYLGVLRKIKKTFKEDIDSMFFYFAGHGSYIKEKSVIWMQESNYPIEEVFSGISLLKPKIQTYIIDSCNSGGKVLTRNKEDELQQYIRNSKGAMFLYACQNTESAQELEILQHGLLTYKVLEAINNKLLYDDKGYLTFNRIVDYVQREASTQSKFDQIPVIENSITGFYPFAIHSDKIKCNLENNDASSIEVNSFTDNEDSGERNIKLKDIRTTIMNKIIKKLNDSLDGVKFNNYEIKNINNIKDVNFYGIEKLKKDIVEYVETQNLVPLDNLIYRIEEKKYNNTLFANALKQIDMMNNIPEKIIKYIVNFKGENLICNIKICISKNIKRVSFGVGYICYQAKWGVVVLKVAFLIDWDGESDKDIKDINIADIAIALEDQSINMIDKIEIGFTEFIENLYGQWNSDRNTELERYRRVFDKGSK